ncbi:unnamed protein product [Prunus armeniaca]
MQSDSFANIRDIAEEELLQGGERQHENPQADDECGVDNMTKPNLEEPTPESPVQEEALCPLVLEETLPEDVIPPSKPVYENERFCAAAQVDRSDFLEPWIPFAGPIQTLQHLLKVPKQTWEDWLTNLNKMVLLPKNQNLETELAQAKEKIEVQHKEFADHEVLLRQVSWRLKTLADQILTTMALTQKSLNKADVEVGLEVWRGKLKQIHHDKLRVDTLHFLDKIKTMLDLLL